MKYLILFITLLIASFQLTWAQNMGHPGGGVADSDNPKFINIKCANTISRAAELEEKFMKSWEKKYKSSSDFFLLVKELNGKFILDDLKPLLLNSSEIKNYVCNKDEPKKFSETLAERSDYQKQLKTLEELKLTWEIGITSIRDGNLCFKHLSDRKSEYENLVTLIKNYQKAKGP